MNKSKTLFFGIIIGLIAGIGIISLMAYNSVEKPDSGLDAEEERFSYYPNTETLGADEMRVIACGTGMPTARPKQAAGLFFSGIRERR